MKTITLTDEAYERLLAWKETPKDSFSKVVDRLIPRRGTLAAVTSALDELPAISAKALGILEQEARSSRNWKDQGDPWTT